MEFGTPSLPSSGPSAAKSEISRGATDPDWLCRGLGPAPAPILWNLQNGYFGNDWGEGGTGEKAGKATSREIKLILVDNKDAILLTFKHLGTKYTPLIFPYSLPNTRDEVTEKWACIRNLFERFITLALN